MRRGRHCAHNGGMKIVYRAGTIIDAHLVKGVLAQEGIPAFISGEHLTGGVGELPACNLVTVMVADIDIERAAPIIAALDAALSTPCDDPAFDPGPDPIPGALPA
jgi:hypothetical protein